MPYFYHMRYMATLALLWTSSLLYAQENQLKNYAAPLDIPIFLSGTFGELRGSNIHAGIDIKTQGKEGFPISAVSNGYVSRIKISTNGYGKAIYISHSDGNTSVYAHLRNFSDRITSFVRKEQYKKESFEVEMFFEPNELPINKKEIIGYSGNTGGSFGPHLHFEIRETNTQKPINPLIEHYEVDDNVRPVIQTLIAYPIGKNAVINASKQEIQIPFKKINDSIYAADRVFALGTIGFGIGTYDRQDKAYNKNGVYEINAKLNGTVINQLQFSKIRFSDSEYLNALIDYPRYSRTRQRIQKLFRSPGNELDFFNHLNDGNITVEIGKDYAYQIKVSDVKNNSRYLFVPIKGHDQKVMVPPKGVTNGKIIASNRDYLFLYDEAEIYIPKKGVFESSRIELGLVNNELFLKGDHVAIRKPFTIKLKAPDSINGHFLGVKTKNKIKFISNKIAGDYFQAKIKSTGVYTIEQDTVAPTIKALKVYNKRWLSNYKSLRFTIDDRQSGIKSYRGTIDGKWALFSYEPKKKELTFSFDKYFTLKGTKHKLKIDVIDNVGNKATHELDFFRK